jgi:hypothetical protein
MCTEENTLVIFHLAIWRLYCEHRESREHERPQELSKHE